MNRAARRRRPAARAAAACAVAAACAAAILARGDGEAVPFAVRIRVEQDRDTRSEPGLFAGRQQTERVSFRAEVYNGTPGQAVKDIRIRLYVVGTDWLLLEGRRVNRIQHILNPEAIALAPGERMKVVDLGTTEFIHVFTRDREEGEEELGGRYKGYVARILWGDRPVGSILHGGPSVAEAVALHEAVERRRAKAAAEPAPPGR